MGMARGKRPKISNYEGGMATKAARGTKRTCQNEECETKFYDLNRDPIACPECETVFKLAPVVEEEVVPVVAVAATPAKPAEPAASADGEEVADDDDALVSLEDADAELGNSDDDDDSEDDTFLATDDDDENAGVSDIIGGGVEKEDEES